ncbi:hypothetical protein PS723_01191 [Pseudomonas fluorescens]|uniref:Uncharacterized protein n=1 Tax=Pseudomonas fluorescens TaxID=294 RepID=A0A5E7AUT3_PSEFL|nr:hypothetical protein PS723_01191 [Pseudomonas fluorescens]
MARYRPTKEGCFLGLFDTYMCGSTSQSYQNWWHINPFGKDVPPMPLKDPNYLNAKPPDKACRLYDEQGLCLEVHPHGGSWQILAGRC